MAPVPGRTLRVLLLPKHEVGQIDVDDPNRHQRVYAGQRRDQQQPAASAGMTPPIRMLTAFMIVPPELRPREVARRGLAGHARH